VSAEASTVAQAKVNLFLRVLAREASGYHQLETLFQRLELGDDVRVRVGGSGRTLDCRGADVGPLERNLAWRAALAYAEATGWPDGFAIEVDKRIPPGGGLGGGSADAGAVLRCLNALAPTPRSPTELLAIAAPLGADVPFLTAEAPLALAWGRGERMLALPPLPVRRVHLALFGEGVSTAEAFAALAERRGEGARVRPILWTPERLARWDDVALVATNDFEEVVFPLREDVAAVRRMFGEVTRRVDALHLSTGPGDAPEERAPDGDSVPIALMSGSGATVCLLTPLDGVEVTFEVRGPDDAEDDADAFDDAADDHEADDGEAWETSDAGEAPSGLAIVETRTAGRVAPVIRAG
jgi:4-diphosphocytidyl-2-C-methyl-D-erythritol kinase